MACEAITMTISAGAAVTITPGNETVVVAAVAATEADATPDLVARVTIVGFGLAVATLMGTWTQVLVGYTGEMIGAALWRKLRAVSAMVWG
jgi:hypothetical protein